MAVTTVSISGSVLDPEGTGVTKGTVVCSLSHPSSALDGAASVRVAGGGAGTITAGVLTGLALVPNDAVTPSGTYYNAVFDVTLANGRRKRWSEKWQLASSPSPIDVGAVPRLEVVPGVSVTTAAVVSDSVLAAATASQVAAAASQASAVGSASSAAASAVAANQYARDAAAVRAGMAPVPLEVPGARKAKIIGLRANLLNRRAFSTGFEYLVPGGYTGLFIHEALHTALAFPGWWTAAKCRELIDLWATSYRPAQHDVAYKTDNGTVWAYGLSWTAGRSEMGPAADLALLVALAIERGDSTVWATHGAMVLDLLDSLPRSGGLVYSDPVLPRIGWGYYDVLTLTGGGAMISAYVALAYTRLAIMADAAQMAKATALTNALGALHRSDGYWNASTDQLQGDVIATALIAAYGLCSTDQQIQAGVALAKDYRAGLISSRGGLRALRYPETWSAGVNPNNIPAGDFINGGYTTGIRVEYACQAMAKAGRVDEAKALMGDQVQNLLRLHRVNANGPQEWFSKTAAGGYGLTGGFAAGFLSAVEPPPQDIVLTLSGAASSSAVVDLTNGHAIDAIEMLSGSSMTAEIAVTAAQRNHNAWTDEAGVLPNSAPTTKLAVLSTYQSFQSQFMLGINSALSWGGAVLAAFTSGSSAGAVVLRLLQRGLRKPRLVSRSQAMTPWADLFSADTLASYLCARPTNWSIVGGYLGPVATQVNEWVLAPLRIHDADVESNLYTSYGVGYCPRMVARWKDQANYLFIEYAGGATIQVYDMVAGVKTSIGSFVTSIADGVDQYTRIRLRGNQVTITSGATSNTYTTNVTWPGLCGVGNTCINARIGFAQPTVQFRDLTITPVHTAQRDMVSDGLLPYTRTGTWTASASRLRSTDTAAPLVAYHADPAAAKSVGVTGVFTSANWATKPAGLCTLASSATQLLYAVCNGTTVSVYDRNAGVDTLLGTMTLTTPVANGADLTMTLRTHVGQVVVKVGSQYKAFAITRAMTAGSAGAYCQNGAASAAEISYATLRVDTYPVANGHGQTIPPGYVLDSGVYFTATASDDTHSSQGHGGSLGPVYLRDETGAVVDSLTDADDAVVVY